jgi:hypothetical protein
MAVVYVGSTKWAAISLWQANQAYAVGDIVRNNGVTAGSERAFRVTTPGTSGATEPAWNKSKNASTNDNDIVWIETTGQDAYGWNAAHATLTTALTWGGASGPYYVSNHHNGKEYGPITMIGSTNPAAPTLILCVDDSAAPPTSLAIGAVDTMGSGWGFYLSGFVYVYGISLGLSASFQCTDTNAHWHLFMEKCGFALSGANVGITIGGSTTCAYLATAILKDCTFSFSAATQSINIGCSTKIIGGSILAGATYPSNLFRPRQGQGPVDLDVSGFDMSVMNTSGSNYVQAQGTNISGNFRFRNCKLGADTKLTDDASGTMKAPGFKVVFDNCDGAGLNYNMSRFQYGITSLNVSSAIFKNTGASDGITPISHKVITKSTNAPSFYLPVDCVPIYAWNTKLSAITVSVDIMHNSLTKLKDNEIWLRVEYLNESGQPIATTLQDCLADYFGTPADQDVSSATWTTPGLGNPNAQKLSVTITPLTIGLIRATVMVAKSNYTVYYDPKLEVV